MTQQIQITKTEVDGWQKQIQYRVNGKLVALAIESMMRNGTWVPAEANGYAINAGDGMALAEAERMIESYIRQHFS